jgi:histidinol phosphatase-like enzyme
VVLIMGVQASGKSTLARGLAEKGYVRLNRDELGGRMTKLHALLERHLVSGERRVVADNTYPTRAVRNELVETAWKHGVGVRCIFVDTPIEQAQVNAVIRMLDRYGRLLDPRDIRKAAKEDPNTFGPQVQYRWLADLEKPTLDEGFESVETLSFVRTWPSDHRGRAVFIELDGVVRVSRSKRRAPLESADVEVLPEGLEVIRRYAAEGYRIIGLAWLPEIEAKLTTPEAAAACFLATETATGVKMDFAFCPHGPGPLACWCRRPLPGLGVRAIRERLLDPAQSLMVGRTPHDRLFAERLGLVYLDHRGTR